MKEKLTKLGEKYLRELIANAQIEAVFINRFIQDERWGEKEEKAKEFDKFILAALFVSRAICDGLFHDKSEEARGELFQYFVKLTDSTFQSLPSSKAEK